MAVAQPVRTGSQFKIESLAKATGLAYIFVLPWEKLIIVPGIGTGSRIVGMLAIAVTALTVASRQTIRRFHPLHGYLAAFVTYLVISSLWADSTTFAAVRSWTTLVNFGLALVLWEVLVSRADVQMAMKAYVLGAYITIAGVSFRALTGNVSEFQRRATLANTDENTVALILALGMPMAWYLATNRSSIMASGRVQRAIMFAYIPAAYLGILFTASRGGFVASLPFLISIPFGLRTISRRERGFVTTGLVAVVIGAAVLAPDTSWKRIFQTREQVATGDISSRVIVWRDGIELWLETPLNMLFGVGTGNFQYHVGKVSHNTPLSVLVEGGLVGGLLFAAVGTAILLAVFRSSLAPRMIWITNFAIWSIAGLSLTLHWHKVTWVLFALAIIHIRTDTLEPPPRASGVIHTRELANQ